MKKSYLFGWISPIITDRGMRRGIQAPELNSGDSPLSTQAPSFYLSSNGDGGVTLTTKAAKPSILVL